MRIHVLQHVPFEDEANIGVWARHRGCQVDRTLLFEGQVAPRPGEYDWLVIMGGPMNIYEVDEHPWLADERRAIADAIEADRTVLGICLGAQLISDVLGGAVTRNAHREIGWYEVRLLDGAGGAGPLAGFAPSFMAFHWHGDTFSIPPGAKHLAESDACEAQAFLFGTRVVGLQFHLDYAEASIATMVEQCADELDGSRYVQGPDRLLGQTARVDATREMLYRLLDNLSIA